MAGGMMGGGGGGKGGGGGGGGDLSQIMAQVFGMDAQRLQQNYMDLGLGPAGQNWTGPGWPASATPSPSFPAGTPFAGQTPGFPAGTPPGTLPTATSTDLSNLSTQVGGAFAPLVDQQNQINQQAQQNAANASGLLGGLGGLGGLGNPQGGTTGGGGTSGGGRATGGF